MRQSFVQAVKQMDPMDALVLKAIRDSGNEGSLEIAHKFNCSPEEVRVSYEHLTKLDCVSSPSGDRALMRPFGTLLMNVVSD